MVAVVTAPVPVPRFRDQLTEELGRHQGLRGPMDDERPDVWQNRCDCGWDDGDERPGWRERYRQHIADVLLQLMEARDQAAAEDAVERAAQAVEALRPHIPPSTDPNRRTSVIVRSILNRAARAVRATALASPAPAPRAEEDVCVHGHATDDAHVCGAPR